MEIEPFSPEEVVETFPFAPDLSPAQLSLLKILLINHFNRLTINHYRLHHRFLNPLTIYKEIPNQIQYLISNPLFNSLCDLYKVEGKEEEGIIRVPESVSTLYSILSTALPPLPTPAPAATSAVPKSPGTRKTVGSWVNDPTTVDKFKQFINTHYQQCPEPLVKISDLLKAFTIDTGIEVGSAWNKKFEPLFESLGIKVKQVPNPRYPSSAGAYHACLMGAC